MIWGFGGVWWFPLWPPLPWVWALPNHWGYTNLRSSDTRLWGSLTSVQRPAECRRLRKMRIGLEIVAVRKKQSSRHQNTDKQMVPVPEISSLFSLIMTDARNEEPWHGKGPQCLWINCAASLTCTAGCSNSRRVNHPWLGIVYLVCQLTSIFT